MKVHAALTPANLPAAPSREQKAFDELRAAKATRTFSVSVATKQEDFMKVGMGIRSASIEAASLLGVTVDGAFVASGAPVWFKNPGGAMYSGTFTGTQDAVDAAYARFSDAVGKLIAAAGS